MKIGIVGGTGDIGEGMALRLSPFHEVIIGSREKEKACYVQECTIASLRERGFDQCRCYGSYNQGVVDEGDIIILAIPYKHLIPTIESLTGFENKIVVSPINPIAKKDFFYFNPPEEGSAALLVKKLLPESARVVTAFNNIAANSWKDLDRELEYSVAVCGDDPQAKAVVMDLIASISNLKAFDAGPLAVSSIVESITPLLLNLARYNRLKDVGIKFM